MSIELADAGSTSELTIEVTANVRRMLEAVAATRGLVWPTVAEIVLAEWARNAEAEARSIVAAQARFDPPPGLPTYLRKPSD